MPDKKLTFEVTMPEAEWDAMLPLLSKTWAEAFKDEEDQRVTPDEEDVLEFAELKILRLLRNEASRQANVDWMSSETPSAPPKFTGKTSRQGRPTSKIGKGGRGRGGQPADG